MESILQSMKKIMRCIKLTNKTDDPRVKVTDGKHFQASLVMGLILEKAILTLPENILTEKATNSTGTYTGAVYPNVNGVNRDDSIMQAGGQTRNTFDMRVGNSDMKGGAVFYNFGYPVGDKGRILCVWWLQ